LPKDAVITVPASWSIHQRNSLVQAAKIAGLDVLGLMKENSAAALYYALERQDNTTHRVLFFNMGSFHI
jgi:molecular chaperone DnaK (HSP70)